MKEIEKYSHMIDEFAWYGKGDIFEIAKMAKKLNRHYTVDIAERKKMFLDSKKVKGGQDLSCFPFTFKICR